MRYRIGGQVSEIGSVIPLRRIVIATLLALTGCSAPQDPVGASVSLPDYSTSELSVSFAPHYIDLVPLDAGAFMYLEQIVAAGIQAWGVELDGRGRPIGQPGLIGVPFDSPFGGVVRDGQGGLIVPVVEASNQLGTTIRAYAMHPSEQAETRLICELPPLDHGLVLVQSASLFVVYETQTGDLRAFRTSLAEPRCVDSSDHVDLLNAPLPDGYIIRWMAEGLVVAGQVGGSYSLFFFDAALNRGRTQRVGPGQATSPSDLSLYSSGTRESVIFTAQVDGSRDVFISDLNRLSAVPSPARRIISSGEPELVPQLFRQGADFFVTWAVEDGGDRIVMAAPLPSDQREIRGGEIVARYPTVNSPRSHLWTRNGLIRASVDDGALRIARYTPLFWRTGQ